MSLKNLRYNMSVLECKSCEEFIDYMDSESYENFRSNVCHTIKTLGELPFLVIVLKKDIIRYCYENDKLVECYYLLGMIDYICRINDYPYDSEYEDIREYKLDKLLYPSGVHLLCHIENSEEPKKEALKNAIPEFLCFNIVEWGIKNVA